MDELEVYKRAVDIAAQMFAAAGYALDNADIPATPGEIKKFLLRKARRELKAVGR